jgi:NAD(P)-dependent dehydrogenase (short-subunit alcohol dehydrogenase family)
MRELLARDSFCAAQTPDQLDHDRALAETDRTTWPGWQRPASMEMLSPAAGRGDRAMTDARAPAKAALLEDAVAVVTGGASGIGGAISRLLAANGASVAIADIDEEAAAATAGEIAASGGRARAHVADVRDASAVARLAEEVLAEHGRVDVLVNNVGHYLRAVPFGRSDAAHWDALYQVNLHHVFLVTRAFLPAMIERRRGSIINVSSVEGLAAIRRIRSAGVRRGAHSPGPRGRARAPRDRVNGIAPDDIRSLRDRCRPSSSACGRAGADRGAPACPRTSRRRALPRVSRAS